MWAFTTAATMGLGLLPAITASAQEHFVVEDLAQLTAERRALELSVRDAEAQTRKSVEAQGEAAAAWLECLARRNSTDDMETDRKIIEAGRNASEEFRVQVEKFRVTVEVRHNEIKNRRLDAEEARNRRLPDESLEEVYFRPLLNSYIAPMRVEYFGSVRQVIQYYDLYQTSMGEYQAIFLGVAEHCNSRRSLGDWLRAGAATVTLAVENLPTIPAGINVSFDLPSGSGE